MNWYWRDTRRFYTIFERKRMLIIREIIGRMEVGMNG